MIVILSGHFFLTKNTHSSKEIRYNFRISKWPDDEVFHGMFLKWWNIEKVFPTFEDTFTFPC